MECAPRQGAVGRARPGLPELESRSGGRKGTGPTGGARLSAGREREAGVGLGREKRKKTGPGKEMAGWAGLVGRGEGKENRKGERNWTGPKEGEKKKRDEENLLNKRKGKQFNSN